MSFNWMLYLAGLLDSLRCILEITFFVCFGIFLFVLFNLYFIEYKEEEKCKKIILKVSILGLIFSSLFLTFIPSKSTVYLMMGNHYLSKSEIPEKVLNVLNKKLDGLLKK